MAVSSGKCRSAESAGSIKDILTDLNIKITSKTIGYDLVSVTPMIKPSGALLYLDFSI